MSIFATPVASAYHDMVSGTPLTASTSLTLITSVSDGGMIEIYNSSQYFLVLETEPAGGGTVQHRIRVPPSPGNGSVPININAATRIGIRANSHVSIKSGQVAVNLYG